MLTAVETNEIMKEYQLKENDTGSVEVQVALLTADIKKLTEHFKINKHDFHSRMGLTRKVNKRRSLLKYLRTVNLDRYRALNKKLGLRELSTAK